MDLLVNKQSATRNSRTAAAVYDTEISRQDYEESFVNEP